MTDRVTTYELSLRQAERDLSRSRRLPGQTTEQARDLLRDAWLFGLTSGYIQPSNTLDSTDHLPKERA